MQIYESVIVVHPRLSDAEIGEVVDKTKKMISTDGGEILGEDKWGRRKLAYPVRKNREGYYVYLKFNAQGSVIKKMNEWFRLQEDVLRTLTVHAYEAKNGARKAKPKAAAKSAPAKAAS
jgi:small subunit ribosomal protein S6